MKFAQPVRRPQPRVNPARRPKPIEPDPDPFAIGRIGSAWSVIGLDALKKRGVAKCLACGIVREITVVDGTPLCGCAGSQRRTAETFASTVTVAERIVAASRHRGRR